MHTILIIDDHAIFRTGLQMILEQLDFVDKVFGVSSVLEGISDEIEKPALILLDIEMPGLNGINGIKVLRNKHPDTPIIMLSASQNSDDVRNAQAAGATGFLNKADETKTMVAKVRGALLGDGPTNNDTPAQSEHPRPPGAELTARQLEVLALLCQGKPNKLIARELNVSENTARIHVSNIIALLGVRNRAEAAVKAISEKIVTAQL